MVILLFRTQMTLQIRQNLHQTMTDFFCSGGRIAVYIQSATAERINIWFKRIFKLQQLNHI